MSDTISAFNLGIQGIHKGMNGLRENAHQIASANKLNNLSATAPAEQAPGLNDVTEPLVYMKLNLLQAKSSAKVIETSANMVGSILDIKT